MFNVRGIIQSCTIALYHPSNVFGNINKGLLNYNKLQEWIIEVDEDCKKCPYVLICKSGYCPLAKKGEKGTKPLLCKSIEKMIRKNLALFALSESYIDILDVG
ncbi:SPASM domain-containing protein [Streptococcus oricebi]|uniref:SPASM domain-containing protein n=1 Tax=Streptococcus oricebi TaxID=1547447 RepID=A0ABS5B186_9STRE|nr:SPASM domain-containing protein [Streptococcus oricebi]MBP2622591.1 hypothetical protein [Streptococcus oricebi]